MAFVRVNEAERESEMNAKTLRTLLRAIMQIVRRIASYVAERWKQKKNSSRKGKLLISKLAFFRCNK